PSFRAQQFVLNRAGELAEITMATTTAVIEPNDHLDDQLPEREKCLDPERRLWAAVLLLAVDEWRSNNMRAHREAEVFLFESGTDFETVCFGAGLDPSTLRTKLKRLRNGPLPETRHRLHFVA
ncbi:MAG: hypothetical protein WB787_15510, partial [Candidatus Acidiferrales bacterium]